MTSCQQWNIVQSVNRDPGKFMTRVLVPGTSPEDAKAALPEIGGHFDNRAAIVWENNILCPFTKLRLSLIAQMEITVVSDAKRENEMSCCDSLEKLSTIWGPRQPGKQQLWSRDPLGVLVH